MLYSMGTAAPAAPHRASSSFAGLLEEYAAPQQKFPPGRDLDGLDDDVVALNYEHALKTHARYSREPESVPQPYPATNFAKSTRSIPREEPQALPRTLAFAEPALTVRKCASVTVRLTAEENDRMRIRAAEADLTISAYLRSCAFEMESMRVQVKEALARMRAAEQRPPARHRFWLSRFLRRSLNRQQFPTAQDSNGA